MDSADNQVFMGPCAVTDTLAGDVDGDGNVHA